MQHAAVDRRTELDRTAVAVLLALCATWGLYQVSVKIANAGISPFLQAGLRSLGSAALLIAWSRLRGVPLWNRDGTLWWGLAAGFLFALEFLLIYWGLTYTNASRAIVFLYTAPFFVAIGAHLFVPGDRITRVKLIGLLAAFAGLLVIFADGLLQVSGAMLIGDGMCLLAAIAWAATTVLVKASPLIGCKAEKTLFYQLGVSALVLPAASIAAGEPGIFAPTAPVLLALAYQIVIVAFVTYLAWFWLITRYPASRLAAFTFLTPVLGVAAGVAILGEPVSARLLLALALTAAGIYLVNRSSA